MEIEENYVDVRPVKGGWSALGAGWAVHGRTEEEAIHLYYKAIEKHNEIEARSWEAGEYENS